MPHPRKSSYPRAILHIDGDGFFASCEQAVKPGLKGKPVVTGLERGIASAMSYEAKAQGVTRGMPIHQIRKACPNCIILPSNYELYSLFSRRMYDIVRRYTPQVEEYGIDECFADLTGMRSVLHKSYEKVARDIKHDLQSELGFTFSLGLSGTKVLAKIGSKWKKPDGLTFIPLRDKNRFLKEVPIGKVWGIGSQISEFLRRHRVYTALDFASATEEWITSSGLAKPYREIWHELNGRHVLEVDSLNFRVPQSIQKTRTFVPPSDEKEYLFSELSKNVENACIKTRRYGLKSDRFSFFLKTQDFRYLTRECQLPFYSNSPQDFLAEIEKVFDEVFKRRVLYRTTGITLKNLRQESVQLGLFEQARDSGLENISKIIDGLDKKYGKHTVWLGSSSKALRERRHIEKRAGASSCGRKPLRGESMRKKINIPSLGEVG